MRVVQTRNKSLVFGILLSVLVVGVMLTLGQVPLAVSQPVTIPVGTMKGAIPMDGANPLWESIPGVLIPLSGQTITIPIHANISVKTVMVRMATNGKKSLGFHPLLDFGYFHRGKHLHNPHSSYTGQEKEILRRLQADATSPNGPPLFPPSWEEKHHGASHIP